VILVFALCSVCRMEWCCNVEVVFYEWECCGIRLGCCGIGMENEFDGGDLHVGAFLVSVLYFCAGE